MKAITRFKLATQLFWMRALGNVDDPELKRLECELTDHLWTDIHRAHRPDYWIVVHQRCSRCEAIRPPPERKAK